MARKQKAKQIVEEDEEIEAVSGIFDAPDTEETDFATNRNANQDLDLDEITEENNFDIFDDFGTPLVKKGDRIRFLIWKNGEYLATIDWFPNISWDYIRTKFGGGTYTIRCRSTKRNGIVKSQSETLAGPSDSEVTVSEDAETSASPTTNSSSDMLLFIQMQKQAREEQRIGEERYRQENREREERMRQETRDKAEESKNTNMMMMQMMTQVVAALQPKNDNRQFELELAKMRMDSDARNAELSAKLHEANNKRFEDLIMLMSKKKEDTGPTTMELLKMDREAEDRGFKKAEMILEMAEERAEELAASREAEGSDEKESLTTSVLKGVLPLLAQAPVQPVLAASPPAGMSPRAPALRVPARAPAAQPRQAVPVPAPKAQPSPKKPDIIVTTAAKQPATKGTLMNGDKKKFIQETVVGVIGPKLLKGDHDFKAAAEESLKRLAPSGISASDLYSQFTLGDMIKTAGELGMPEAIKPYLEGFYAHIEAKAGTVTRKPAEPSDAGATVQ